jgi:hypothetical protein
MLAHVARQINLKKAMPTTCRHRGSLRVVNCHGVVTSIESWQLARTARNLAAHDYETDYDKVAEHFNTLHELVPEQVRIAAKFMSYCAEQLKVEPLSQDFALEFQQVANQYKTTQ